jgi:hypothetical protein
MTLRFAGATLANDCVRPYTNRISHAGFCHVGPFAALFGIR